MKKLYFVLLAFTFPNFAQAALFSCNLRAQHAICTEYRFENAEGNEQLAKQKAKCTEEQGIPSDTETCPEGQAFSCVDDAKGYTIKAYPELGRIKIAIAKKKCRDKGGQVR
jgi:hypothetical protein